MRIRNTTPYRPEELLRRLVPDFDTAGLLVEIKHARGREPWTGTCYPTLDLIRVRVNPRNSYPCQDSFATGEYTDRFQRGGYQYWSQRVQRVEFDTPEELVAAGFLHEFSHYLDHQAGRNPRWKQTKADKFALEMMRRHGIGRMA